MAVRTAAAADLDATVTTLKTQLATYINLQQGAGDNPAEIFWLWFRKQLREAHPSMAIAIDTGPIAWGDTHKTLADEDGYA